MPYLLVLTRKLLRDLDVEHDQTPTEAAMNDKLLKMKEAADRLNIGPRTLERIVRRGELPVVTVGGGVRIAPTDLAAYVEANRK